MSRSAKKRGTLFGATLGAGVRTRRRRRSAARLQEDQKLGSDKGNWSNKPTDYNYYWVRCGGQTEPPDPTWSSS